MATIFCDTDCELWYTTAKELDLQVIEMPYIVNGEEIMYDLGENTDIIAFYKQMRDGAKVATAGLNQQVYTEIFEPFFEKGEDILYIAFSEKMSGTFKYLELAINELKQKYPKVKYRQFDTKNICMGAGILVYLAAKYFNENGKDVDKTYDYLESIVDKVGIYFVVDDMKYLARGGRISESKARIGNLMQIKPVLTVNKEGEIDVCSKQNGIKKAHNFIIDTFKNNYKEIDDSPVVIVDADCKEVADSFELRIKEAFPQAKIWRQPIGPVIGAHAGPGTIGLIYTTK